MKTFIYTILVMALIVAAVVVILLIGGKILGSDDPMLTLSTICALLAAGCFIWFLTTVRLQ